jgi:L-fuconolactonase
VIDAHQHFWRIGRHGQVWPTADMPALYRDALPDEFELLARQLGVSGSVAVQSQPDDRDTEFLLALTAKRSFVRGVVGWADLEAPGAAGRVASLASRPKFRGLRPMLQSLDRDDWIADARIDPAIQGMIDGNLVFDALVQPRHLAPLWRFAARWPALTIVIDHAAKPPVGEDLRAWRDGLAGLAELPNVHCKLSGLLTEVRRGPAADAVPPVIDQIAALFGSTRLLWGSDWPVLKLAGRYEDWLTLCRDRIQPVDHAAVFGGNARRLYRL